MRVNLPKLTPLGALLFGGGGQRMVSMGANGSAINKKVHDRFPRQRFHLKGSSELAISKGDLTQWEGDAIVNAANELMLGGGGVDGAIHRAAGPELQEACWNVKQVARGVRCPEGEARITPGFRLNAEFVIHTVGPIFDSHEKSAPILASAFKNSLQLLKEKQLKTIAFPAISCGVYRYPIHRAAKVSITTILQYCDGIDLIEFVLFGQDTYDPFVAEASRVLKRVKEPEQDDDEAADEENRKHAAGDEHGASKTASVESSPQTSSASEGKAVAEKESGGGQEEKSGGGQEEKSGGGQEEKSGEHKPLDTAPADTAIEGADEGMDIATAKLKRDDVAEDAVEPDTKVYKDEQTATDGEQTAAPQANDPPTSEDKPPENAPVAAAAITPLTQTESDSADAKSAASVGASTAEVAVSMEVGEPSTTPTVAQSVSMDTASQVDTVTMAGEGSREGGGGEAEAVIGMDTETQESQGTVLMESQETVLMEDSPEETLTLPGESPSEGPRAEQSLCPSGETAQPVKTDNRI